jgi:hypothetical protein
MGPHLPFLALQWDPLPLASNKKRGWNSPIGKLRLSIIDSY